MILDVLDSGMLIKILVLYICFSSFCNWIVPCCEIFSNQYKCNFHQFHKVLVSRLSPCDCSDTFHWIRFRVTFLRHQHKIFMRRSAKSELFIYKSLTLYNSCLHWSIQYLLNQPAEAICYSWRLPLTVAIPLIRQWSVKICCQWCYHNRNETWSLLYTYRL